LVNLLAYFSIKNSIPFPYTDFHTELDCNGSRNGKQNRL